MKNKTTKSLMFRSLLLAACTILLLTGAHARTWTSADGTKTFDAELKIYCPATGMVRVILSNGKSMDFTQDKLSAADAVPIPAAPSRTRPVAMAPRMGAAFISTTPAMCR